LALAPQSWYIFRQHLDHYRLLGAQYVQTQTEYYHWVGSMDFAEWLGKHWCIKFGTFIFFLGVFNLFIQGWNRVFLGPNILTVCRVPFVSESLKHWSHVVLRGRRLRARTWIFLAGVQTLYREHIEFDLDMFVLNVKYFIWHFISYWW
jgi:hypothetical protein